MPDNDALIKEFEAVRAKYQELLQKLVAAKIPGLINPVAAGCAVGEVCHGGTFDVARNIPDPARR